MKFISLAIAGLFISISAFAQQKSFPTDEELEAFKKKLQNQADYAPQFLVLYWRWTEHPSSLNFKKQFEENFPLEKLRSIIDK